MVGLPTAARIIGGILVLVALLNIYSLSRKNFNFLLFLVFILVISVIFFYNFRKKRINRRVKR